MGSIEPIYQVLLYKLERLTLLRAVILTLNLLLVNLTNFKINKMKTLEMKVETISLNGNKKSKRVFRMGMISFVFFSLMLFTSQVTFAHCDTMDGPVVMDARRAIEQNNINYVLKWVSPVNEAEIKETFNLLMNVRGLSSDAKKLAEKYFFETLVRVHRMGEGVPFTGVKPLGTPIDEKILAADKSIELGNLSPLKDFVEKDKQAELDKRFEKVMSLKNFDVNNIEAGREYIEAYVQFFHFAEGEED